MRFYAEYVFDRAEEYFDAQRRLREREQELGIYWPRYSSFCHAVELGLKAFLATAHAIDDDATFKGRFGYHDLEKLLNEAIGVGLSISVSTQASIKALNEAHMKHWARYVQENGKVFTLDQFDNDLVELFTVVCRKVRCGDFRKFVHY